MTKAVPEFVQALDDADPLRAFRQRFALPPDVVYLDGNSLGALPVETMPRLERVVREEWGAGLIRSWNNFDWVGAPRRIGDKIASLIGARAGEVVVADSTSVNIFKLLMAALGARPGRNVILTEAGNFPTDLYVAQGIAGLLSNITVRAVTADEIPAALTDEVAVLLLTHVHYKTGRKYDMVEITRRAHACGALMIWDLSHSVGAVEVNLAGAHADMAVGCGYKYLNGGPGAPAFLYVAQGLQAMLRSPITGWFGHAAPFDFDDGFCPAADIGRFLSGTPPVLGLMGLETGVDLMLEAPHDLLFRKSRALCSFFIEQIDAMCGGLGLEVVTTRKPAERGSHVSLRHVEGYPIVQALIARDIIGDFRAPDIVRFGFAPLYLRFADVWRAVDVLREVLETRDWDQEIYRTRAAVT